MDDVRKAVVAKVLALMSEHFDAGQVLVSWVEPSTGETRMMTPGFGNFYARMGMAETFLSREDECTRSSTGDAP